jgi:flagellar biosynthesis/type III secretory pathway ATPase
VPIKHLKSIVNLLGFRIGQKIGFFGEAGFGRKSTGPGLYSERS